MGNARDTYGSLIRNYLTPLCNINDLIKGYQNGEIEEEMFLELIKMINLDHSFKKLLELSHDKIIDTIYVEDFKL